MQYRNQLASRTLGASLLAVLAGTSTVMADYQAAVTADNPLAYYRFNESTDRSVTNYNVGSLGAPGNATNLNARAFPGAIVAERNRSQFYDSTAWSTIPWNAALNPDNTHPFTMEAWFYPASDQINGGQAVINNRYSYSGVDRQGWVIFQRAPDDSYSGQSGYEGVGWNFRMYRGSGSSSGLDLASGVPYQVGTWTHMVVVYDPVDPSDVSQATLTIYINGVMAGTTTFTGGGAGYVANTDDHPASEAVNGPSGITFGSYNNTQPGSNPYFGAVDEFAFYDHTLSPASILSHYQNGTNAAPAKSYSNLILEEHPVAFLRMDELPASTGTALNLGDLRNSGYAAITGKVQTQAAAAIASPSDASFGLHGGGTADIDFAADNNPSAGLPFTFEGWFKPDSDRQNAGQSPVNNRYVSSGNRTGWVIFQRAPNDTYSGVSGYSGVGWNFRMYSGTGSGGQDVVTSVPYTVGQWQHCVFTWQPDTDNGDGSWTGTLSAYVNGVLASSNDSATYKANESPTEDGTAPADLAVGAYNKASGLGANSYEGSADEIAIYNNYALTQDQILAHYQAGTNAHPAVSYESLVLSAAYAPGSPQRTGPKTYLRFNDPAANPAFNSGSLGKSADAALQGSAAQISGPVAPLEAGLEDSNLAASFDGLLGWTSLNNPAGLNIAGNITLEVWIKPDATVSGSARIISHGPPILSLFTADDVSTNGSVLSGSEVFLKIDATNSTYAIGTSDGTNTYSAEAPIPAGDLGGGKWIHLAGTYDGTKWNLYRNGAALTNSVSSVGALPVGNGNWAIGSAGSGLVDYYSGGIDEAAIYNRALTPEQVLAHYNAAVSTAHPVTLSYDSATGQITLTWPSGTLQQAAEASGAFAPVPGATSPYTVAADAARKFYRVK